jgi:hypothetical protein
VEFVYNHSVLGATKFSPFEVMYGFNPYIPIDLVSFSIVERTSINGVKKAKMLKKLHEQVQSYIEEKMVRRSCLNLS